MSAAGADPHNWPWPAPVDDGACDHLKDGNVAVPDLALTTTAGVPVNLAQFGRRAGVFVYPFMGGPGRPNPPGWDEIRGAHGSTPQAEGYAALAEQFRARGCDVFGLSGQPLDEQRECASRLGLPFALVNDTDGAFRGALRLPTFAAGDGIFLRRVTLVIDAGRIVMASYPVHPPDRDAERLLRALDDGHATAGN